MSDHHEIFTQFFFNHEVLFSSHIMFINTSTKVFTLVNNAIPRHGITIEHFLYYKMVANVYQELDNIFKNKTFSILICQSFPFKDFAVIETEMLDNSYRTRQY